MYLYLRFIAKDFNVCKDRLAVKHSGMNNL